MLTAPSASRRLIVALQICLLAAAIAVTANPRTLRGEVVDVYCHLSDAANHGDAHADCALSCAKRGAVLGVLTDDGVYTIVGEYTFEQNKRLIPLVARQVVATGEVSETEELRTIRIASIELAK